MEENTFGGRRVVARALTGSHNYNLNTPASDEDWKFFVVPTFDDLYRGKMFSDAKVSETYDYSVHDVRQLGNLLWKANLNYVEVLYSVRSTYDPALGSLFLNRERYGTMNLPAFYNATFGMHLQKMASLHKGTGTTQEIVDRLGYDTKQACHALRCLFVLQSYIMDQDMRKALWFESGSFSHYTLLKVKAGGFTEAEFLNFVERWQGVHRQEVKDFFAETKPNEEAREEVEELLYNLIKNEVAH